MNQSDVILFFQEYWRRLNETSPKFFRVIGWISMIAAAVGFIPQLLDFLDITLPAPWMKIVGKCMIAAGVWGKLTSAAAIKRPASQTMPFTEKKQLEQDIKKDSSNIKTT